VGGNGFRGTGPAGTESQQLLNSLQQLLTGTKGATGVMAPPAGTGGGTQGSMSGTAWNKQGLMGFAGGTQNLGLGTGVSNPAKPLGVLGGSGPGMTKRAGKHHKKKKPHTVPLASGAGKKPVAPRNPSRTGTAPTAMTKTAAQKANATKKLPPAKKNDDEEDEEEDEESEEEKKADDEENEEQEEEEVKPTSSDSPMKTQPASAPNNSVAQSTADAVSVPAQAGTPGRSAGGAAPNAPNGEVRGVPNRTEDADHQHAPDPASGSSCAPGTLNCTPDRGGAVEGPDFSHSVPHLEQPRARSDRNLAERDQARIHSSRESASTRSSARKASARQKQPDGMDPYYVVLDEEQDTGGRFRPESREERQALREWQDEERRGKRFVGQAAQLMADRQNRRWRARSSRDPYNVYADSLERRQDESPRGGGGTRRRGNSGRNVGSVVSRTAVESYGIMGSQDSANSDATFRPTTAADKEAWRRWSQEESARKEAVSRASKLKIPSNDVQHSTSRLQEGGGLDAQSDNTIDMVTHVPDHMIIPAGLLRERSRVETGGTDRFHAFVARTVGPNGGRKRAHGKRAKEPRKREATNETPPPAARSRIYAMQEDPLDEETLAAAIGAGVQQGLAEQAGAVAGTGRNTATETADSSQSVTSGSQCGSGSGRASVTITTEDASSVSADTDGSATSAPVGNPKKSPRLGGPKKPVGRTSRQSSGPQEGKVVKEVPVRAGGVSGEVQFTANIFFGQYYDGWTPDDSTLQSEVAVEKKQGIGVSPFLRALCAGLVTGTVPNSAVHDGLCHVVSIKHATATGDGRAILY